MAKMKFHHANTQWVVVHLDNLKPQIGLLEKRLKLRFTPLLCTQQNKHANIHLAQMVFLVKRRSAMSRHDDVIDKQWSTRFALLQRWHNRPYDLDAVGIVVVVQDLSNQECIGILSWLGLEEVVLLEGDAAFEGVILGLRKLDG